MSARIESRVFSAAAFLSWAEVGDDDDDDGDDGDSAAHIVALPPGTVSPAGLVVLRAPAHVCVCERWWSLGHKHWFAVSGILVEPVGHVTQSEPSW